MSEIDQFKQTLNTREAYQTFQIARRKARFFIENYFSYVKSFLDLILHAHLRSS